MAKSQVFLMLYLVFTWLLAVHTFEEIGSWVFDMRLGKLQITRKKYLAAASFLSALNLVTLGLIFFHKPAGFYLAVFMAVIPGVLQGVVHTIGFLKNGKKTAGLGVGFYSSIPLSLMGTLLLYLLWISAF